MRVMRDGFQKLLGTADLLPEESARWTHAEAIVRATMRRFGFGEIRTPIMEPTGLFEKGTGASTDIVQKEMYTFTDRGDRSITLRPEGTPSAVRAYLEASLGAQRPVWKLFYSGPMFRAERPQKGRLRQFHQYGAELIGSALPAADVEIITLAEATLRDLGVGEFSLILNSIGDADARNAHNAALRDYLGRDDVRTKLCDDCIRRAATNPLRIFDCKKESCLRLIARAPTIDGYLTDDDRSHFDTVRSSLKSLGIPYEIDVRMVRGLDYYTRTTFEIKSSRLGAQDSLLGGGRYDRLVELYDGPPTPAVGFAAGWERILDVREMAGAPPNASPPLDVFVCTLGEQAQTRAAHILAAIRTLGFSADRDFLGRGLKAQMKDADRSGARYVLIVGDDEIARGRFTLRRMDTSEQTDIDADHTKWTQGTFAV